MITYRNGPFDPTHIPCQVIPLTTAEVAKLDIREQVEMHFLSLLVEHGQLISIQESMRQMVYILNCPLTTKEIHHRNKNVMAILTEQEKDILESMVRRSKFLIGMMEHPYPVSTTLKDQIRDWIQLLGVSPLKSEETPARLSTGNSENKNVGDAP